MESKAKARPGHGKTRTWQDQDVIRPGHDKARQIRQGKGNPRQHRKARKGNTRLDREGKAR